MESIDFIKVHIWSYSNIHTHSKKVNVGYDIADKEICSWVKGRIHVEGDVIQYIP